MHVGNHCECFGRIERCAFRKLYIDLERICTGQFHVQALAGLDGLLPVGHLVGEAIARLKLGVAKRKEGDDDQADRRIEAGPGHHPHRDPAAKPSQHVQSGVHVSDACHEFSLVANEQHAKQRQAHQNRQQSDRYRNQACFAERPNKVGLENCKAMNDTHAVAWVSTQAGPTMRRALRKAVTLSSPASRRSRAAKVSCMLSEKLMTMISGVITFRNIFKLKPNHPSAPSARRMAMSGGPAAIIMNDTRRKNMIAMRQPTTKPSVL